MIGCFFAVILLCGFIYGFKAILKHDLDVRKLNAENQQKELKEGNKELTEEEQLVKIREELGM